jgi:hypothetical protein
MLTLSWFRHKPAVQSAEAPLVRFTFEHEVQLTEFTLHLGFRTPRALDLARAHLFGHSHITGWSGGDSWEAWCEPATPGGEVALHIKIVVRDEEWEQALTDADTIAHQLYDYLSDGAGDSAPIEPGWLTRTDDWSADEWRIGAPIHGVNRA